MKLIRSKVSTLVVGLAMLVGACGGADTTATEATTATTGTQATTTTAQASTTTEAVEARVIGVEASTFNSPFFAVIYDSMAKEAAALGIEMLPVVNPEFDVAKQATDIRSFLNQGVNGLIVVPVDSAAIVSSLEMAAEADVPVVTIDILPESGPLYISVRAQNKEMGRAACEAMGQALTGEVTVVEVQGNLADSAGRDRSDGFRECMSEFPNIEVLEIPAMWQADKAAAGLEAVLTSNPDLAGIYLHSGGAYFTATNQTLERAGLWVPSGDAAHIYLAVNDGGPEELEAIRGGFVDVTVSQPADLYAKYGVHYIGEAMNGTVVEPGPTDHNSNIVELPSGILEDELPVTVVTLDNVDDPALWGNAAG